MFKLVKCLSAIIIHLLEIIEILSWHFKFEQKWIIILNKSLISLPRPVLSLIIGKQALSIVVSQQAVTLCQATVNHAMRFTLNRRTAFEVSCLSGR